MPFSSSSSSSSSFYATTRIDVPFLLFVYHISSYHICHSETSVYARGVLNKVLYGEAGPRGPNLYPFKTGTPFVQLPVTNGIPFRYLVQNVTSL